MHTHRAKLSFFRGVCLYADSEADDMESLNIPQ
jgi:hypothetical protein